MSDPYSEQSRPYVKLKIVTCYGCERTFPRDVSLKMDDGRDGCPFCGTRVVTSLQRGDGSDGDRVAGVIG